MNHYEVLDVKKDATSDEIREAFLKQSKECHPDLNHKDPNNHEKFVRVNEAYSVLSKPVSKREYDLTLADIRGKPQQSSYPGNTGTATQGNNSHSGPQPRYKTAEWDPKLREMYRQEYQKQTPKSKVSVVFGCVSLMVFGVVFAMSYSISQSNMSGLEGYGHIPRYLPIREHGHHGKTFNDRSREE
jgi:curved DNA-binding protein CbpA